jgi:hypothetical protein
LLSLSTVGDIKIGSKFFRRFTASVVDTGGKFTAGFIDTGRKFTADANVINKNPIPTVSLTPAEHTLICEFSIEKKLMALWDSE